MLWELVHVFIEHNERTVHDTGAASFVRLPLTADRGQQEQAHDRQLGRPTNGAGELKAGRERGLGRDALVGKAVGLCPLAFDQAGQRPPTAPDAGQHIVGATDASFGRGPSDRDTLYVATDGGAFTAGPKARGQLIALQPYN